MGVARFADFVCASLAVTFAVGCSSVPESHEGNAATEKPMTFQKLPFAREAWQDPPLIGGEIVDLYLDRDLLIAVTRASEVHATGVDGIPRWISTEMSERPRYRGASNGNALVFVSGVDLVSLDRANGKMLRKARLPFAPSCVPAASETTAYLGSYTDQKIHAMSLRDGSAGWTFRTNTTVSAGLAIAGLFPRQILYFGAEDGTVGALEALDAESLTPSNPAWQKKTHGRISADLTVSGNIVFVPCEDETLYAMDRVTGDVRWTYPAGVPLTKAPVVTVDTVFQPIPSGIVALSAADGLEKYRVSGANRFLIQWGKRALFLQDTNTIVVANTDSGAVQSRVRFSRAQFIVSNPDGRQLVIADRSGRLYALEEERALPEKRPTP
ncbi:MAG: PQQ-binding-like beta-propeller repeat protein [Planctomycetes bacterium]|nr:PQQ-binding-like beta-propeller repeat protein [Planctomycetota bacterium]MBI3844488.1 PQQ-binding-like beta-propeller repeat protein [Planctomycetota bacterium]